MKSLPWWLARPATWASDVLVNELHVELPGMPGDPFGSAIITSVGMFGIDSAFAPFVPLARCPMLILVPEVRPRPWAVGDSVEVRPVLRLCATFDHRIIDGAAAGRFAARLAELFASPALLA
jgi:pyruvate dehydrogenase E2 component (dihydrolipoamide acetyltransferase)